MCMYTLKGKDNINHPRCVDMTTGYHWWHAYGNFGKGVENLPHVGHVIRYYRKLAGMERADLATFLCCTKRYIEMLESEKNLDMPQLLSRRVHLAKRLHIPPILLGLSSVVLTEETTHLPSPPHHGAREAVMEAKTMAFYEGMLALSWEAYYTSSIERATENIASCFDLLNQEAREATGIQKDQYDAIRARFYRLCALTAREHMKMNEAAKLIDEAIALATRLKNAELIAASLLGRIRICYQKQAYEEALKDAEQACFYADQDLLRDPLKGKVYQMAGEAQAYLAGSERALQEKSLASFEKAGRIVRKRNLPPDGSFVKTDLTSIAIQKAKALRLFGRFEEAHNAFAIARKNLSPELTRWQVNLLIEEARTYYAEGDITSCCRLLLDALPIVRALHLQNRKRPMQQLLEQCKQQEPNNPTVVRLEKAVVGGQLSAGMRQN